MIQTKVFYIKQGDTRPHFVVSLREGGAKPLSDLPTVCKLTVVHVATGDVILERVDMAVLDAAQRKYRYTFDEDDTPNLGDCHAVLYLEFADGGKQHAPTRGYVPITVESALP